MANSLLNLREIRLETLRAKVEFCLPLTVRLRVNEIPSLVSFEHQTLSYTGIQVSPLLATFLTFRRIVAKLRGGLADTGHSKTMRN